MFFKVVDNLVRERLDVAMVVFCFAPPVLANVVVDRGTDTVRLPPSAGVVSVLALEGKASLGTVVGGTVTTITSLSGPIGSGVISAGTSGGTAFLTVYEGDYGGVLADKTVGAGILTLTKTTPATLVLSGPNTYTGGTRIEAGEIVLANNYALGTGKVTVLGGTLSGDALNFANALDVGIATRSTVVPVKLGQTATAPATTLLILNGAVAFQQPTAITVPENANVIIAGTVSGKGFIKNGRGNLYLQNFATNAAPNTHGKQTTLKSGVLGITEKSDLGNSRVKFEGGALDLGDVLHARQVNAAVPSGYDIASAIASIDAGQTARIIAGTDSPHRSEFSSGLSGLGSLEVVSGTLRVAPHNFYSGRTIVNEGATLVLPAAASISNSFEVLVKGTLDGTAGGFTFKSGQPVEILNGGNHLAEFKVKDGSAKWSTADLTVDIARRIGAFGPGISQTGVPVNGTSSPVRRVTLKVMTPELYSIGVEQVESATPVEPKDYFTAYDLAGNKITDRTRIGAVSGGIVSARPIYAVSTASGLRWSRLSYAKFGAGTNGANFGRYLDQQISETSTEPLPSFLRDTVDELRGSAEISRVLQELSARPFADMPRLGIQRSLAVLGGVEDRLTSLAVSSGAPAAAHKFGYKQVAAPIFAPSFDGTSAPAFTGQPDGKWATWGGVYTRDGIDAADENTGTSKVSTSERGVRFGIERQLGILTLGLTGAEGSGRYRFENPAALISSDFRNLGLYGLASFERGWLDAALLYGTGNNRSTRTPQLGAFTGAGDVSYRGTFDSGESAVSVGFAYNLCAPDRAFQATPVARLNYLSYNQAAFGESDEGIGTYRISRVKTGTLFSKLGQRFSLKKNLTPDFELESDLGAYWQHGWGNRANGVTVSLGSGVSGTSYEALGGNGTTDVFIASYGIQITLNRRYLLRGSTSVERRGRREIQSGGLTFAISF